MLEGWGGPALARVVRDRAAADRRAQRRARDPVLQCARRASRVGTAQATCPAGIRSLAFDPGALQAAILLRAFADLRSRRQPRPCRTRRSFVPSTRPGTRAPHAWLAGWPLDRSICSATVLCCCGLAPSRPTPRRCSPPPRRAASRCARSRSPIRTSPRSTRRKLVLVRPDGHVAWRGDECPADAGAIVDRVRGAALPHARDGRQRNRRRRRNAHARGAYML